MTILKSTKSHGIMSAVIVKSFIALNAYNIKEDNVLTYLFMKYIPTKTYTQKENILNE